MSIGNEWENSSELKEALRKYEDLKAGRQFRFLDQESFELVIDYYDDSNQVSHAIEAVNTALEYYPFSAELMVRKADLLIFKRKSHEALSVLETALTYDAENIDIYILKTEALLALDRSQEAYLFMEDAIRLFTGEEKLELLLELADVFDDYEAFDKVFECLKIVLTEHPTCEEALYKICFWTDFTGRYDESIALYQEIINKYPYCEVAWYNLGNAYQSLKLFEKAIEAYWYCIDIEEKYVFAYRNLGECQIRIGKFKEAIETLEKLSRINRPDEVIYEAIGYCYYRLKNFGQARFNYRKASHIHQEDSRLIYKIALTYLQEGKFQSAISQLETCLKMQRKNAEYHVAMGESLLAVNRVQEGLQHLGQAVLLKPRKIAAWECLIKALIEHQRPKDAVLQCKAAIEAVGSKPLLDVLFGIALLTAGKEKEGLIQLDNGIRQMPKLARKIAECNMKLLQNVKVLDIIGRTKLKAGKKKVPPFKHQRGLDF
jgi:tetratricopeptide (TPR) repeat protein